MSEELRFKYLEELERSEALDGAVDTSRERRRRQRSEEAGRNAARQSEEKDVSRRRRGEASRSETVKKKHRKKTEQNTKKQKRRVSDPERSVRNISVSENTGEGRRRRNDYVPDSSVSRRKKSGKSSGTRRGNSRRIEDWDAIIEENARLEAEDLLREEREIRKRNRTNAARRRQREAEARQARIIRIVSALVTVAVIVLIFRVVYHLVRPSKDTGTGTSDYQNEADMSVTAGTMNASDDIQGTAGTEVRADVTIAPTSSVVSIDSSDQLTTLFENWVYVPGPTDVAPEGDIVPTDDTFYSHDMMKRDLYLLRERYPESMTILRYGYSADGRDLLDVVIGNPAAQKDVIIQYSMHAREYVNSLLGMKQIEELLKGISNGTQYQGVSYADILQGVRLHLIPMYNPDGVMIALYGFDAVGNETLRKSLYECWQSDILLGKGDPDITAYYKRWKANARCVDLNRNFDCGWETTVGTTQPSCSRYKGEAPASEAETKALVALKDAINCVGEIAYHSEGELVYWDYGSLGDLHLRDEQIADIVCSLTGYKKESTLSSGQETAGCSDYFVLECGVPAITIETGVGECPIYIDQWENIWNQNSEVIPAIAQYFAQL